MKKSKSVLSKRIVLPEGFHVSVPAIAVEEEDRFSMNPSAVYVECDLVKARFHYSGEEAERSFATFEIPGDADYLRKLARALNDLAKQIENRFAE